MNGNPQAKLQVWSYLPALDGVRAIAVAIVVLFHFWPDIFAGGFIGVDVFFVMSGFLITGILLEENGRNGRVNLRAFWGRRVRRLVPAVLLLVSVTSIAAALTKTGSLRQFGDSIGALTWTTNLVEAMFGDLRVWRVNSRTTLDHLWSLAIEEQFYLLWPLIAMVLFRWTSKRRSLLLAVGALMVLSAIAMGTAGPRLGYFRTDARAFELLAGAALALASARSARIGSAARSAAGAVGLVGVVVCVFLLDPNAGWMYPWGFILVSLISTALVIAAIAPPRWLAMLLEAPPMRVVGQRSYGVYLWHIPVLRLLSSNRVHLEGVALQIVRFAVLAVIVEFSYRLVEQPIRSGNVRLGFRAYAIGYTAVAISLIPMGFAAVNDVRTQWDPIQGPPAVSSDEYPVMVIGDLLGAVLADAGSNAPGISLWSLADPGCAGLSAASPIDHPPYSFLDGDTALPIDEYCRHWPERIDRSMKRFEPQRVVIAGGYWDTLEIRKGGQSVDPIELDDLYTELLNDQVAAIRSANETESGSTEPEIVIVRIEDWSNLVLTSQRPIEDRQRAAEFYNDAIDALVESDPLLQLVAIDGSPTWKELRTQAVAILHGE